MVRLISLGLLSAAFFSSTFVLNRLMSLDGDHWVWTASLRYAWIIAMLVVWLTATRGIKSMLAVGEVFTAHWKFWCLAGTVAYGLFYAPLCFVAAYAPGWVVASTWQTTILATPIVLLCLGQKVPLRGVTLLIMIFAGILLVNLKRSSNGSWQEIALSVAPVLLAAFAYPIGNALVAEAKNGGSLGITRITGKAIDSALNRTLLLAFGSVPFWILLVAVSQPGIPTPEQGFNTALVALLSGVIGTSIYFHVRHNTRNAYETAAVDSTQAGETVFALTGEVILLGGLLPSLPGWLGLALIVGGIALYTKKQTI